MTREEKQCSMECYGDTYVTGFFIQLYLVLTNDLCFCRTGNSIFMFLKSRKKKYPVD